MEVACDLSDPQRIRLRVAAKGAIEYALKERQARIDDFVHTISQNNDARAIQIAVSGFFTSLSKAPYNAAEHRIWTKTIESVLTTEQRTAYASYVEQRAENERQRIVASVADVLVRKFSLTADQGDRLGQLVDLALADRVRIRLTNPLRSNIAVAIDWTHLRSITAEQLQAVLTDALWKQWQALDARVGGRNPIVTIRTARPASATVGIF